jgi:hypothetical protein
LYALAKQPRTSMIAYDMRLMSFSGKQGSSADSSQGCCQSTQFRWALGK